jgi:tripartite motif-containing protein 71
MTSGSIDTTERERFDPLQRTRDFRFLTREQRTGRNRRGAVSLSAGSSGGNPFSGGGSGGPSSHVTTVTKLPDAEKSVVAQFFLKRNQGSLDTLNIGILDENDQPIIVPLNTLGPGSLDPVAGTFVDLATGSALDTIDPYDVAVDASGNIYVSSPTVGAIRVYDSTGNYLRSVAPYLATFDLTAGSSGVAVGQFNNPNGLVVDSTGRVLIADTANNRIQRFTSALASPAALITGLNGPTDVTVDGSDNIYVANHTGASTITYNSSAVVQQTIAGGTPSSVDVQKIGSTTYLAVLHDSGTLNVYTSTTAPTGFALLASFATGTSTLGRIALEPVTLRIFVVDSPGARLKIYDWNGVATWTLVATVGTTGLGDGQFSIPVAIAQHPITNNVVVSDTTKHAFAEFTRDGYFVRKDVSGAGVLNSCRGLAFNPAGDKLYNMDLSVAQRWSTDTTKFSPYNLAWASATSELMASDDTNSRVARFAGGVSASSFVGSAGSGNGQFTHPRGIGFSPGATPNMYVVDQGNSRVQYFTYAAGVYTYNTQIGSAGTGNGQFTAPTGLAILSGGSVLVVDAGNKRIQQFSAALAGYVTQFGGYGNSDGQFQSPQAIGIDREGRIWVTDLVRDDVQVFDANYVFLDKSGALTSSSPLNLPYGVAFNPANGLGYVADRDGSGRLILIRLPLQNFPVLLTNIQDGEGLKWDALTQFFVNRPPGALSKGRVTETIDDFDAGANSAGNAGRKGWSATGTAGIATAFLTSEVNNPGLFRIATPATLNAVVALSPTTTISLNDIDEVEVIFRGNQSSNYQHGFFLSDNINVTVNAVGIYTTNTTFSGRWIVFQQVAGVGTSIDTGIAFTTAKYVHALLKRTGNGSFDVTVTHNGSTFTTSATGLTSSVNWFPMFRNITLDAVAKSLDVDYYRDVTSVLTRV